MSPGDDAKGSDGSAADDGDSIRVGSKIGACKLLDVLWRGATTTAYRAEDRLGRKVALKVPRPGLLDADGRWRERLLRSTRLMATLNHPNVVAIYDQGEHEGRLFWTMELVRGRSLEDTLREDGPMPAAEVVKVMSPIAKAVQLAHDKGFVHGDVRPRHIMVTPAGRPVLMGFERASPWPRSARSRRDGCPTWPDDSLAGGDQAAGGASWTSPEEALGRSASPKSDVWALGATTYRALAGRFPYEAASPGPVDTSPLDGHAPPSLIEVVARCLREAPEERYATADELANALGSALDRA